MYKQGDIVIVRYPFSDNPKKSKKRPAVVVSNEKSNSIDQDLLICPITTTIRLTPFSYSIDGSDTLIPLPKNSEVRCNKVVTMRSHLLLTKFTECKPASLNKVLKLVRSCF